MTYPGSGRGERSQMRNYNEDDPIIDEVLSYIPMGSKNAVKRKALVQLTGLKDRQLREYIHFARRRIPIINLCLGRGYYIPDMNTEKDQKALTRWVRQEESRLKSIGWALKAARQTLRNCGIDWRTDGIQTNHSKKAG